MSFFSKVATRFTATASALAISAVAAFADQVQDFYLTVTSDAFDATYGDALTPENIERLSFGDVDKSTLTDEQISTAYMTSIAAVLGGTKDEYQSNYIGAAQEYFESLSAGELQALENALNYQPTRTGRSGNLLGKVDADLQGYTRGGRTPNLSATNPLFSALYVLAQDERGMLSREASVDAIKLAASMTHGSDFQAVGEFHDRLIEALDAVQEAAAPAPVAGAEAVPKISFD